MTYYGYVARRHARKIHPWIVRLENATDGLQEDLGVQDTSEVLESLADVSFWRGRVMGDLLSAGALSPSQDPKLANRVFEALMVSQKVISEAHQYLLQRTSPDLAGFRYLPHAWTSPSKLMTSGLSSLLTQKNQMLRGEPVAGATKGKAGEDEVFVRTRDDMWHAAQWTAWFAVAQRLYEASDATEGKGNALAFAPTENWKTFWGDTGTPGDLAIQAWKKCSGYSYDIDPQPSSAWMTDAFVCLWSMAREQAGTGKRQSIAQGFVRYLIQEYLNATDVKISDENRAALIKISGDTVQVPLTRTQRIAQAEAKAEAKAATERIRRSVAPKTAPSPVALPTQEYQPPQKRRRRKGKKRRGQRRKKKQESWWAKNWWIPVAATGAIAATVLVVRTRRSG